MSNEANPEVGSTPQTADQMVDALVASLAKHMSENALLKATHDVALNELARGNPTGAQMVLEAGRKAVSR